MRRLLLILLVFLLPGPAMVPLYAQVPQVVWQHAMGGPSGDREQSMEMTSDGGYIAAGYTLMDGGDVQGYHTGTLFEDLWVVKTNASGTIEWQRCLGGARQESGGFVKQTPDGGYIVSGSSSSSDCGLSAKNVSLDYYLVKLNANGVVLWQKQYGGSRNEFCWGVTVTSDGGYVLTGHTESNDGDVSGNHGLRDVWTIKTDASGNLLWQKCYGGAADDVAYSVSETTDKGLIIGGYTESNDGNVSGNHGGQDLWALKLKADGSFDWQRTLGGTKNENGWGVKATPDGGAILTGSTLSNDGNVSGNHGGQDVWVVKLNSTGALDWQHCYGGSQDDIGYGVDLAPGGGYVVAGSSTSADGDCNCTNADLDAWAFETGPAGTLEWQKKVGGNYADVGIGVHALSDGSFVMGGFTCSKDIEGYHDPTNTASACEDFWIVKLSYPVIILTYPLVTLGPIPSSICANRTGTFTALAQYAGTNPTYVWKRNGIVSKGIPGGAPNTYTASDFNDGDQLSVTVTAGGVCFESMFSTTALTTIHTNYVPVDPVLTITANTNSACGCAPVEFTATTQPPGPLVGPRYYWTVNGTGMPADGPTFRSLSVKAGDKIACSLTTDNRCLLNTGYASNVITMGGASGPTGTPGVAVYPSATSLCTGAFVSFTATATNMGAAPTYQWKVNGVDVAGATNALYSTGSLVDGDQVSCEVTVDPNAVCTLASVLLSTPVAVHVLAQPAPSVSVVADVNDVCAGKPLHFMATAMNGGRDPSYVWSVNGADVGGDYVFERTGLHNGDMIYCTLTPGTGACSTTPLRSNSVTAIVRDTLAVSVRPADTIVYYGTVMSLSAVVGGAGGVGGAVAGFVWTPAGSLVDGSTLTPVTVPLQRDVLFRLAVTGSNGCVGTGVSMVRVTRSLSMPTAFTPNGDGVNDVFRIPPGIIFDLAGFEVYDRWGQKVFSARRLDDGWDGRVGGHAAPAGTYIYYIKGKDVKGMISVKGTVTLVR